MALALRAVSNHTLRQVSLQRCQPRARCAKTNFVAVSQLGARLAKLHVSSSASRKSSEVNASCFQRTVLLRCSFSLGIDDDETACSRPEACVAKGLPFGGCTPLSPCMLCSLTTAPLAGEDVAAWISGRRCRQGGKPRARSRGRGACR